MLIYANANKVQTENLAMPSFCAVIVLVTTAKAEEKTLKSTKTRKEVKTLKSNTTGDEVKTPKSTKREVK